MNKLILLIPLAALGASCGGDEPEAKAKAERPAVMPAGQWSSTMRVRSSRTLEPGEARITMANGTEIRSQGCLAGGNARPPAELFGGDTVSNCRWWDNTYMMRNGRLMANATCQREGIGNVELGVNVTFTDTEFEGTVEYSTRAGALGDVLIVMDASGRLGGACVPGGAGDNQSNAS